MSRRFSILSSSFRDNANILRIVTTPDITYYPPDDEILRNPPF